MFEKILIANRGEIACRIIRTARRMGIATAGVYSEVDADALHVRLADEALPIGPAPPSESYLNAERILESAKACSADAIHPGFGFLAENADFARRVRESGIAFIGPPEEAMRIMGDKIASKRLAVQTGVNTIPGHVDAVRDADEAAVVARDIGFPVMLKASAGGGGKGMRVARSEAEVRDGFLSAGAEALSSFGDGRVFLEKLVEHPRHIEIQVLADRHGNIVHLGERECSIQRRHQKVLEEAPSPFLDSEMRAEMGEQAKKLAAAAGYFSVGTVEFIVDPEGQFYFLEMNTRLQVEHPVTEFVIGADLVEQMIRIEAGEKVSIQQSDVTLEGWAVEARVYAEDPERGFLPATGRLGRYRPPAETSWLRVDDGVDEGAEISVFYDPMIAKLVAHGRDRSEALSRLAFALDRYTVRGVAHNLAFLNAVVRDERFRRGELHTGFIDEIFPNGFDATRLDPAEPLLLAAVAGCLQAEVERRDGGVGRGPESRRTPPLSLHRVAVNAHTPGPSGDEGELTQDVEEPVLEIALERTGERWTAAVRCGAREFRVESAWRPGESLFEGRVNGGEFAAQVERLGLAWQVEQGGCRRHYWILPPRSAELRRLMPVKAPPDLSRFLLSPMPGLLLRLSVAAGDTVEAGQELAVVEAMKMENALFAGRDGTVARVLSEPGDNLAVDQAILEFE